MPAEVVVRPVTAGAFQYARSDVVAATIAVSASLPVICCGRPARRPRGLLLRPSDRNRRNRRARARAMQCRSPMRPRAGSVLAASHSTMNSAAPPMSTAAAPRAIRSRGLPCRHRQCRRRACRAGSASPAGPFPAADLQSARALQYCARLSVRVGVLDLIQTSLIRARSPQSAAASSFRVGIRRVVHRCPRRFSRPPLSLPRQAPPVAAILPSRVRLEASHSDEALRIERFVDLVCVESGGLFVIEHRRLVEQRRVTSAGAQPPLFAQRTMIADDLVRGAPRQSLCVTSTPARSVTVAQCRHACSACAPC